MISCEEAQRRWHLGYDDGSEDAELEGHLTSCEACREYSRQMRRIVDALGELKAETETVVARGDDATACGSPRGDSTTRWTVFIRLTRVAAVLAVLVVGGLFISRRFPGTETRLLPGPTPVRVSPQTMSLVSIRLEGESAGRYLAVRRPRSDDNVQMIWLYPSLPAGGNEERP